MVLQQQYRNKKFKKYSELINVLLAAETPNELLMKNYHMRPVGAQAGPEAHASFRKNFHKDKGQGQKAPWQHKGGKNFKKYAPNGPKYPGKGKVWNGPKHHVEHAKHPNQGCRRCGSMKHWSRTCRAEPHLIKLYQEWKEPKDAEAHFVQVPVDTDVEAPLPELPKEAEAPESSRAMDVDPTSVSGTPTNGDDDDINLDVDDLLGDDELDMYGDME